MRSMIFATLVVGALATGLTASPSWAAAAPDGCQGVATGTSTCTFRCDFDDVTGIGQLISVTFAGDTGAGGRVTASCGGVSVSCTAGATHVCVDTSSPVRFDQTDGTCTGTGFGAFACQTS